ncbi:MAG: acyl--CoA ligase [Dehalococcoidales bacterium]|nr:acyl--CoA ligase [Dehalococcoidales bacterium]
MMKTDIDNYLFTDMYELEEGTAQKVAITFKGRKYTFEELSLSVNYFANKLIEMGVKEGDHVALLSMNSYNWFIAFLSIVRVGAVAVLNNYILRHDNLVSAIKNADCNFLIHGKFVAGAKDPDEPNKLIHECGIKENRVLSIREKDLIFKHILKDYTPTPLPEIKDRETESRRTSHIIFTTGTTGAPKAVMLSQYGIMNIIYHNLYKLDDVVSPSFMCLLPMFHSFGLLVVLAFLAYKRVVSINEMSSAWDTYKEFRRARCGDCASVSTIFDKLARAPGFYLHKGYFVKRCIVGGGFTSEKQLRFLERRFSKAEFLNGYGLTECSPLVSLVFPGSPANKRQTAGLPMDDLDIIIQDTATKEIITEEKRPGEILIKGYALCNGYYNLPQERQPFDKDGYLHTGDLGYLDDDGYLNLTGRIKDIIIRKGENISPSEIEKAFEKYKEFTRVRVLGFPSLTDGEYIIAAVELKRRPLIFNESTYLKDLHSVLPSIKIPTHIIYLPKFPLTANGKLDEKKLREQCLDKMNKVVDRELYGEIAKLLNILNKQD